MLQNSNLLQKRFDIEIDSWELDGIDLHSRLKLNLRLWTLVSYFVSVNVLTGRRHRESQRQINGCIVGHHRDVIARIRVSVDVGLESRLKREVKMVVWQASRVERLATKGLLVQMLANDVGNGL